MQVVDPLRPRHHDWLVASGMAVLLCLFGAAVFAGTRDSAGHVGIAIEPLSNPDGAASLLDVRGNGLLLPGGTGSQAVAGRLRFTLPADSVAQSRWVVFVPRMPVDAISLQAPGQAAIQRSFFRPAAAEGLLPVGFVFPLDGAAGDPGERVVDLRARGALRGVLRPLVLRESDAALLGQQGAALAATLYASLFILALLALALYSAARDRTFLAYFVYCLTALLLLASSNGHLFQVPGLSLFAAWGAQGLWALALLFGVSSLQVLQRYAGLGVWAPRAVRVVDGVSIALVTVAAVCLLGLPALSRWVQPVATVGWILAAVASLVLVVDAARRRVPMALPMAAISLLGVAAGVAWELAARGGGMPSAWLRHGYQFALVLGAAALGVGLVSRIGEFRDQRDRERLARADTERRMRREKARSELGTALQLQLRTVPADDIEAAAFRMLLDALLPQVPAQAAAVVAYGYHGHDVLVVDPPAAHGPVFGTLARRGLVLKRLAALAMPVQQPGTSATNPADSQVIEAVVPLAVRSPGWGVLLLERAGPDGFSGEELGLAGEFVRMTLMHADQALASIKLRQSAEVDALTGTFNRRTIDQWLSRSFSDAVSRGEALSVLFVDLDHFKAINDRLGHACGDHCLREIAAALRIALGESNLLARYGGEEFIAVLPGHGGAAARMIGEQLRAAVENTNLQWEGQPVRLTVSVGVATRLDSETTPASTIDRADKALYAAKRSGRNCVQVAPAVFA